MKTTALTAAIVSLTGFASLTAIAATDTPYTQTDGARITLSGTVESAGPDSFVLDYGQGTVAVEMDDWDWYQEGYKVLEGDQVTVAGNVDDDVFEMTSIEASSVYVEGLNSYFFASSVDEESAPANPAVYVVDVDTTIEGTVAKVGDGSIKLDTGEGALTVNTDALGYDPLDEEGFQQIEEGDRIAVTGELDTTFFGKREFTAESITSLSDDNKQSGKAQSSKS